MVGMRSNSEGCRRAKSSSPPLNISELFSRLTQCRYSRKYPWDQLEQEESPWEKFEMGTPSLEPKYRVVFTATIFNIYLQSKKTQGQFIVCHLHLAKDLFPAFAAMLAPTLLNRLIPDTTGS